MRGGYEDLALALAEFRAALPHWWVTCGECGLSAHASCGPDSQGEAAALCEVSEFAFGFDADLEAPGATMADAVRDVLRQALAALAETGAADG